ncbi:MAG TPA: hypothetical protein VJB95_00290 [Candidatus Paceibacterota bacterium]
MEIKLFTNKNRRKHGNKINPAFYWYAVLSGGIILALTAFVFSFYLFQSINTEATVPAGAPGAEAKAVRKERIDKALDYFAERKNISRDIIISPSTLVDPSL